MTDSIFDNILVLGASALSGEDEVAKELLEDLLESAYKYTGYRMRDNFLSREQRNEVGAQRTACHNRYMDTLVIFLRYEKSLGKEVPDISNLDRKTLGDIGNRLVAEFAIRQR